MRYKKPDSKNALSIIEAAERKMVFTLTLQITDDSASTVASNIYDCFRMLGDALFVMMGIMETGHKEVIDELLRLEVDTQRPISAIANLRRLRHNIHYYGYEPTISEVLDMVDLAKKCFSPLLKEVKTHI